MCRRVTGSCRMSHSLIVVAAVVFRLIEKELNWMILIR
jgi:hypothetical protein